MFEQAAGFGAVQDQFVAHERMDGRHDKGLADRTRAIHLDSRNPVAYAARGNAYFLLQRYDEAAADLRAALERGSDDPTTRQLLERAEAELRPKPPPVVAAVPPPPSQPAPSPPPAKAPPAPVPVEVKPAPAPVDGEAAHARARQLLGSRQFTEAIPLLDQVIAAQPDHALALNARGFAHMMVRDLSRAIADFQAALRAKPDYQNAKHNLATAERLRKMP